MVAMCGVPRVTMPAIRSGRRTASTRANMPPRLWPMSRIGWSVSETIISMRRSSVAHRLLGAVDVGPDARAARRVADDA